MASQLLEIIPEIFSAQVLDAKLNAQVHAGLANRNYEGEVQIGNQVRIPQINYPAVNSYTRNSTSTLTLGYVASAGMQLTIDQEKYVHDRLDAVDAKQNAVGNLTNIMAQHAGYSLANDQDAYIAGLFAQCGITTTSNTSGSRITIGSSNVRTELLLMARAFDRNNVQQAGRYLIAPPELTFELKDAGILEQSNNDNLWANGRVANAYGWNIYQSNNVNSSGSNFNLIFGVANESITLAEQILETEFYKLTDQGFGVAYKALHVYGARLISDRAGVVYATISNN